MRFAELKSAYDRIRVVDKECRREYRISERHTAVVDFIATRTQPITTHIRIERITEEEDSFPVHIIGLSPAELVKFAEIKATVERWVEGGMDVLPPSTCSVVTDRERKMEDEYLARSGEVGRPRT